MSPAVRTSSLNKPCHCRAVQLEAGFVHYFPYHSPLLKSTPEPQAAVFSYNSPVLIVRGLRVQRAPEKLYKLSVESPSDMALTDWYGQTNSRRLRSFQKM